MLAGRLVDAMPFLRRSEAGSSGSGSGSSSATTEQLSSDIRFVSLSSRQSQAQPQVRPGSISPSRAKLLLESPKKSMIHIQLQKPQDIKCLQYSDNTEVKVKIHCGSFFV
jgi:hypothetical protein